MPTYRTHVRDFRNARKGSARVAWIMGGAWDLTLLDRLANEEGPAEIEAALLKARDAAQASLKEQESDAYAMDLVPYRSNYASESRARRADFWRRKIATASRLLEDLREGMTLNRERWDEESELWVPEGTYTIPTPTTPEVTG